MQERKFILQSSMGIFDKQGFKDGLDLNDSYEHAIKDVYEYCIENATDRFMVWLVNKTHDPSGPLSPLKAEAFLMENELHLFDDQGIYIGRSKNPKVVYVEDGDIKHKESY